MLIFYVNLAIWTFSKYVDLVGIYRDRTWPIVKKFSLQTVLCATVFKACENDEKHGGLSNASRTIPVVID